MISRVYRYGSFVRLFVYSIPVSSFAVALYLKFGKAWLPDISSVSPQNYLIFLLFTELVWVLAVNHYKLSAVSAPFGGYSTSRDEPLVCLAVLLSQTALLVFFKQLVISRIFIVLSNVFLFIFLSAVRQFYVFTLDSSGWLRKRAHLLVIGTDHYAVHGVQLLRQVPSFNFDIRAYVQLPGQDVSVQDGPVIGHDEITDVAAQDFDEIVVAIPAERYLQMSLILESLQQCGKPIRASCDLGQRLSLGEKTLRMGQFQMINLDIPRTESFAYGFFKRAFDVVGASLGIVILSPVFLAIAILIKASDPGPIIFRQERVGRNGRHFTLLKFRTMRCGSVVESNSIWTRRNDSRCTSIGKILRKFSLDELPQLVNVLSGEMSLVGPRPERPFFVAKFRTDIKKYEMRHCCQVGITGWAQIHGLRGDTSIPDRLKYDLDYINNWSLGLDLKIVFRTMFSALKSNNGY